MKHILNDLTEQEKNAIREQHTGGMKVINENFSKLINSKLGDSKPLVAEQTELGRIGNAAEIYGQAGNAIWQSLPIVSLFHIMKSATTGDANSVSKVLDQEKNRLGQHYDTLKNAITQGDIAKTMSNMVKSISTFTQPYIEQMKSGMGNQPTPSTPSTPTKGSSATGGGKLPTGVKPTIKQQQRVSNVPVTEPSDRNTPNGVM